MMNARQLEARIDLIITNYSHGFSPESVAESEDAATAEIFIRTALRIAILGAQCKRKRVRKVKRNGRSRA